MTGKPRQLLSFLTLSAFLWSSVNAYAASNIPTSCTLGSTCASNLTVRSVTKRPPSIYDDNTQGYAVGNLWNVPGLGEWVCQDATTGMAVWEPVPTGILPLDSVPGVVLHGWGTRKLRQLYAGAPLAITPSGGSSTDIGFDPTGNINKVALSNVIGGSSPITTSSTASPQTWSAAVTTWYDQTSTTAYNLTVPSGTGTVAPQISPLYTTYGSPTVAFADGGMNVITDAVTPQVVQHPRLWNASLGAGSAQNMTLLTVDRNGSSGNAGVNDLATFNGSSYPIALATSDQSMTTPLYSSASLTNAGQATQIPYFVPSSPSVFGFTSTSSAWTAIVNSDTYTSSGAINGNTTTTNFYLGGLNATQNGFANALSAVIVGPGLTPGQLLLLRESLVDTFQLTPQVRDRVILAGASTEAGADGWMTQTPLKFAEDLVARPFIYYNFGVAGSTTGGAAPSADGIFSTTVAQVYKPYALNILSIGMGSAINSLANGTSLAQTTTDWQTWMTSARGLGSNVKIIAVTVPPTYALASMDSTRTSYNSMVRSNSNYYDVLLDEASSGLLGSSTVLNNTTYIVTGQNHRTPYAQSLEGMLWGGSIVKAAGE